MIKTACTREMTAVVKHIKRLIDKVHLAALKIMTPFPRRMTESVVCTNKVHLHWDVQEEMVCRSPSQPTHRPVCKNSTSAQQQDAFSHNTPLCAHLHVASSQLEPNTQSLRWCAENIKRRPEAVCMPKFWLWHLGLPIPPQSNSQRCFF